MPDRVSTKIGPTYIDTSVLQVCDAHGSEISDMIIFAPGILSHGAEQNTQGI